MRFTGQGISRAVLGAIAAWRLGAEGARIIFLGEEGSLSSSTAFGDGYRVAMLVGAAIALAGAAVSWTAKPKPARAPVDTRARAGPRGGV